MGFFTSRERGELGKSAEPRLPSREREVVRHDFAPRRRPQPTEPDLTGHVGTLMRRVSDSSLRDIDDLIDRLQRRREQLLAESERVQREIIEYAKLSQTTMQSTKIIAESLAHFNKVPESPFKSESPFKKVADAPRMSELHLGDDEEAERRNGRAKAFAELDEEEEGTREDEQQPEAHGTPDGDAEEAERPDRARSESA